MNRPKLQFLGGAETVTGSKTLLEAGDLRVLVDCGLFQGIKKLRLKNWDELPVDPGTIDHVLLTHGHLDHVGYLPKLVKQGFNGKIHGTSPTMDVAKVILKDSAKIQEEDAKHANKEDYTKHDPARPLYTIDDAHDTFKHFIEHDPRTRITLNDTVNFQFRPNGHILGSTLIELLIGDKRITFSGDLGRQSATLHDTPKTPQASNWLILESTYGDRLHPKTDPKDQLEKHVTNTISKGGHLIVPSFALGRAQELMYLLHELRESKRIPDCPIYLDSPMGVNITKLYQKYLDWHSLSKNECDDITDGIELIKSFDRTRNVLSGDDSKIIIAGSGMLTGGRVLFYLERLLDDPSTTVLLTGFQAEGTRGRLLQDGAPDLKFHGEYHSVKADVRELTNLSAHADQQEIIEWLDTFDEIPNRILINHGEPQASQALRVRLTDRYESQVDTVQSDESYTLEIE